MTSVQPGPEGDLDGRPPTPLRWAIGIVAAEGLALTGFGLWLGYETVVETASNQDVARGSTVYFIALGLIVVGIAWALRRRHGWAGGAGTFLQLLALPIAWTTFRVGAVVPGLLLGAAALVGLVVLNRSDTRDALGR